MFVRGYAIVAQGGVDHSVLLVGHYVLVEPFQTLAFFRQDGTDAGPRNGPALAQFGRLPIAASIAKSSAQLAFGSLLGDSLTVEQPALTRLV